ncbi:hypothetical protein N2152v2_002743 [Parachlorella kessleri]
MDVRDLGQGKLSKTDQKKLQQDIKTLTKKATGLLQSMNDRLKDLRDKNYKLALEQQYITVQPAWGPAAAPGAAANGKTLALEAPGGSASSSGGDEGGSSGDGRGNLALVPAGGSGGGAGDVAPAGAAAAGPLLEVEREAALMSPLIQKEVVQNGLGLPGSPPVHLPKQVTPDSWAMVQEYCRFHLVPGRSDKERRMFDERFIKVDTNLLCELTSAADALDMRPLVDLASRAIAKMIEGKSPDQIREAFRLPDDLTEEEKLEPLRTVADDPRIRMLNRLYAKKRKELQERKAQLLQAQQQAAAWQQAQAAAAAPEGAGAAGAPPAAAPPPQDPRSLEELLSFIEADDHRDGGGAGGGKPAKVGSKGRSRKKKAKQKAGVAGGVEEAPGAGTALAAGAAAAGVAAAGVPLRRPGTAAEPGPATAAAAAAAGTTGANGVGEAANGTARSPASTLPAGSLAGSVPTTTAASDSGRSSLDSSPDRLSVRSTADSVRSTPAGPAGQGAALRGAAAAGATASPHRGGGHPTRSATLNAAMCASLPATAAAAAAAPAVGLAAAVPEGAAAGPLPGSLWLVGRGGFNARPWHDPGSEVDATHHASEYGSEVLMAAGAIPANLFAARTALLHRPISTLTSLSAFRARLLPADSSLANSASSPAPHQYPAAAASPSAPPAAPHASPQAATWQQRAAGAAPLGAPAASLGGGLAAPPQSDTSSGGSCNGCMSAAATAAAAGLLGPGQVPPPLEPAEVSPGAQQRRRQQQLLPDLGMAAALDRQSLGADTSLALLGTESAAGDSSCPSGVFIDELADVRGADAAALAALFTAFVKDLGLEQHLSISSATGAAGSAAGQGAAVVSGGSAQEGQVGELPRASHSSGSSERARAQRQADAAPSAMQEGGSLARAAPLPGGGTVELYWRR